MPVSRSGSPQKVTRGLVLILVVVASIAVAPTSAATSGSFTGRVSVEVKDSFKQGRSKTEWLLETGSERLVIKGNGKETLRHGDKVRLQGNRSDGTLTLASGGIISSTATAESVDLSPTTTPKVAVILANFATDTRVPWTADAVSGVMFGASGAAGYWKEVSNGQMAISGDVYGYFTLDVSISKCDYGAWMNAAKNAATAAAVPLSNYTNYMLAFPKQSVCGWGGMANVSGRNSWINGSMTTHVTSHELGHNFGVHHASSLTCTAGGVRVPFSSNCTTSEYGDPYDVMGNGTRHTSNWHRRQVGFLKTSDQQTVTASGTYRMATVQLSGGSPRVLRVARPSGDFFYVEWRQVYGTFDAFASTSPAVNGVIIRQAPDSGAVQSRLIDTTPATTSFTDAPLTVGSTFVDPVSSITITTASADSTGASITVRFGASTPDPTPAPSVTPAPPASPAPTPATSPTPTPTPPTPSPSVTPTPTATPADAEPPTAPRNLTAAQQSNKVQLRWEGSTDDSGSVSYQVLRDGAAVATTTNLSLSTPAKAGSYTFMVRAVDPSGNVSPDSNAVTFTITPKSRR